MTDDDEAAFLAWARPLLAISRAQILQDLWALWTLGAPRRGYVLDVGAADGVHLSNSFLFERLGWSGLLVEPNPRFFASLADRRTMPHVARAVWRRSGERRRFSAVEGRPDMSRLAEDMPPDLHDRSGLRADARTIEVETIDAADLMTRWECPESVDYLSLDVEGAELAFLETVDWERRRFRCLTVEHNWTPQREAIAQLLKDRSYVQVFPTLSGWDDWWVAEEVRDDRRGREAGLAAFAPAPEPYLRLRDLHRERAETAEAEAIERLRAATFAPPSAGDGQDPESAP